MAVSDTAKLIVDLSLKGNFARQMGANTKALDKFAKGEGRAYRAGAQIGTGIKNAGRLAAVGIAALASQVALGLDSLIKLEGMTAQTEAVLKSTGSAAGVTAVQVRKLAEQYEALNATVGDEVIQNAENLLLTFTKINEKAFEPALAIALDMNQALGGGPEGLAGTVKLLGKALQDPEKGLSRLGRAVGGFSDETVKAVKAALKNNDVLKAQRIIIDELTTRYGGSFARAGDTTAAKVAKFGDAIEDLQRSLAVALLPTVSNVADALTELLLDPAIQKGTEDLGREIGKLFSKENIKSGIDALRGIFNLAREVAPVIASSAKVIGSVVSAAVKAFQSLPPEIQALAVGAFAVNKLTGGLVTNIGGGLISAVLGQLKSAVVTVHGGVVNVSGPGVGGTPGKGGGGVLTPIVGVTAALIAVEEAIRGSEKFGAINTALSERGLNAAEIAAQKYYTADPVTQQTIIKKLGYQPTRADLISGTNKLAADIDGSTAAVERNRATLGAKIDLLKTNTIAGALASKNAIDRNAGATRGVQRAVDRKDLSVKVNVSNRTVINGRVFNSAVGKDITYINGLPYGGTPQGGR